MTQNSIKITKEQLRIASRFLKEVGLYSYWIRYLYSKDRVTNWSDKIGDYYIVDVLGRTQFTDFLKNYGVYLPSSLCVYEIFALYVCMFYPEIAQSDNRIQCDACSHEFLSYDIEKKKLTIVGLWKR